MKMTRPVMSAAMSLRATPRATRNEPFALTSRFRSQSAALVSVA
jgi:hypothetical protein